MSYDKLFLFDQRLPILMLITEPVENLPSIVEDVVWHGGVSAVMWRDKTGRSFDRATSRLMYEASKGWAGLIPNGDKGTVEYAFVTGYHLGEADYNPEVWANLLWLGEHSLELGRSVHSVEAAVRAKDDKATYLIAGTIYPSNSHPGEPGQGVGFLREVCAAVAPLPVIAIGGITPERVGECIAAGAAGVAVLSPIMRADDPQAVARTYREALDTAWKLRN